MKSQQVPRYAFNGHGGLCFTSLPVLRPAQKVAGAHQQLHTGP